MTVQLWKNGPLHLRLIAYISINYLQFRLPILFMFVISYSKNITGIVGGIVVCKQYNSFKYYLIVTFK